MPSTLMTAIIDITLPGPMADVAQPTKAVALNVASAIAPATGRTFATLRHLIDPHLEEETINQGQMLIWVSL